MLVCLRTNVLLHLKGWSRLSFLNIPISFHLKLILHPYVLLLYQIRVKFRGECTWDIHNDRVDASIVGESNTRRQSHYSCLWWNVHVAAYNRSSGNVIFKNCLCSILFNLIGTAYITPMSDI